MKDAVLTMNYSDSVSDFKLAVKKSTMISYPGTSDKKITVL